MVEFSGEGEQDWLALQLDKIIAKVPELLKIELASPENGIDGFGKDKSISPKDNPSFNISSLATWLKEKGATTNQTKKFLATATYVQIGGKNRIATNDIVAALKKSNQSKLTNPSDCLNKNVAKGLCEKDGTEFFVTVEGLAEFGIK